MFIAREIEPAGINSNKIQIYIQNDNCFPSNL